MDEQIEAESRRARREEKERRCASVIVNVY